MLACPLPTHGRGAPGNPKGRFEKLESVCDVAEPGQLRTQLFRDSSKSILAFNDSPDVGFSASLNPYRGCEHGCVYCFARPTHETLGLSAGLDFESKIFVKTEAPRLLREALAKKSWVPQVLGMSGVTDCYQPVERRLSLTRACLQVLAEFRNPVVIITKNHLVTRDIDLLAELAAHGAAQVMISITTLDGEPARKLEPRASRPERRLEAVRQLTEAGIPVGVMMAPVIPGLTDHEMPKLLEAAAQAGAAAAYYTMLRLPYGVKDLFADWLAIHAPTKRDKVLHRIESIRGGKRNDPAFGSRMVGQGEFAEQVARTFALFKRKYGLDKRMPPLSTASFRRADERQLALF